MILSMMEMKMSQKDMNPIDMMMYEITMRFGPDKPADSQTGEIVEFALNYIREHAEELSEQEFAEIKEMFGQANNIDDLGHVFTMLRERYGSHDDHGDQNIVAMIFDRLKDRFPDPEKADMRDIVGFFMDMLREIAPELGQMEREMIRERLSGAENINHFMHMVEELEREFADHGNHDDHGPGGAMPDMSMLDPERMNQDMLAAIPEFMNMVM